jgi:Tat protein translocase TatB subunit
MFGTLGGPELFLILVVALIVFGPRRLPEIGKSMGRMLAEFRKASNDFKRTIEDEIESENRKGQEAIAPPPGPAAGVPHGPAGQTGLPEPISPMPAPRVEPPGEPTVSRDTPGAPPAIEPK